MPHRRTKKVRPPTVSEFTLALSAWEGQFIEFKESISGSLARDVVAFANSNGGRIYIGVADDKSVKGVQISNRLLSQVQSITRHCDPPITVNLVPYRYKSYGVLIIDVPEGSRKPYGCGDGYFLRTGASSQKMNREELIRFVRAQGDIRFGEMPCEDFRYPADFAVSAFKAFLSEAKITAAHVKNEDLLVNLGVAKHHGRTLLFNNAGVIFFAKKPRLFHLQSRITCLLFQGTDKTRVIDRKDFDGVIIDNVENSINFLRQHIPVRYEIAGLKRKEISAIPDEATREALLNAVIHRDYFERGGVVMVELFRDRLEISSPGGLLPGFRLEDLGRLSLPRNPLIADFFLRMGEVERAGTGIGRMRKLVMEAGLKPPVFESNLFFSVKFPLPETPGNVPPEQLGASKGTKLALSRHQVQILELCKTPRPLVEIMEHLKRSDRTKFRSTVLGPLLSEGLIAPTIPDKPRSGLQKYVATAAGARRLKEDRQ